MQLKARVKNLSSQKSIEPEVVFRTFMMECILERISASNYRDNFILKGGVLIASIVGIEARSTMDIDTYLKAESLTEDKLVATLSEIVDIPVDDGVSFEIKKVSTIREFANQPCFRVLLEASFDGIKQFIQVDISTGDYIIPKEIEYEYRLLFEDRTISLMAYNLETILAEKFEAIITLGIASTRLRDYYDVYLLTSTQPYNSAIFRMALEAITKNRNTFAQVVNSRESIDAISKNEDMIVKWKRYQDNNVYAAGILWEMVIDSLLELQTAKEDA